MSCTALRTLILRPKEIGSFIFIFTEISYKLLLLQSFFPDHMISFPSETDAAVSHSGVLQVCNLYVITGNT